MPENVVAERRSLLWQAEHLTSHFHHLLEKKQLDDWGKKGPEMEKWGWGGDYNSLILFLLPEKLGFNNLGLPSPPTPWARGWSCPKVIFISAWWIHTKCSLNLCFLHKVLWPHSNREAQMSQSTGKKSGPLLRSPAGTRDAKTAPGSHCCLRHLPCCALYGSTLYFKKCVYAEMFLILLILKPIAVDEVISFVWCLLNILLTFDLEITKLYRSLKGKAKNSCFLCT